MLAYKSRKIKTTRKEQIVHTKKKDQRQLLIRSKNKYKDI